MMTWSSFFFNSPCTLLMELVVTMHDYVMMFLVPILFLVLMNLYFTIQFKCFNLEFYENHQLESVWTVLPFLLLLCILVPSLKSLYMLDSCMFCGLTISVVGHQWYWSYSFKDISSNNFDSYMLPKDSSILRVLDVDNRLIISTALPVRFLVSSADVIHSWTIPSFGIKMDAVPGRLNQFCFSTKRDGVFFGQCSEICGANHSFMPIVIESLNFNDYMKIL